MGIKNPEMKLLATEALLMRELVNWMIGTEEMMQNALQSNKDQKSKSKFETKYWEWSSLANI